MLGTFFHSNHYSYLENMNSKNNVPQYHLEALTALFMCSSYCLRLVLLSTRLLLLSTRLLLLSTLLLLLSTLLLPLSVYLAPPTVCSASPGRINVGAVRGHLFINHPHFFSESSYGNYLQDL